jgi:hypothetical protein
VSKAIVKKAAPGKLASWQQEAAQEAKDVAAREQINGQRISFKGGQISIGGEPVGDKLPVIITDFCCGKAFYEEGFQEGVAQTPGCYAFGYDEKTLAPHPQSPSKQAETCAACPHNKMGSAEQGKGKRCKDERRLAVISSTADDAEKTDVFTASISPTSIRNWANYVKYLREQGMVPWSTFTEISLHAIKGKAYKEIRFTNLDGMTEEMYRAIKVRQEGGSIKEQLMAPYPNIEVVEPKPRKGRDKTK